MKHFCSCSGNDPKSTRIRCAPVYTHTQLSSTPPLGSFLKLFRATCSPVHLLTITWELELWEVAQETSGRGNRLSSDCISWRNSQFSTFSKTLPLFRSFFFFFSSHTQGPAPLLKAYWWRPYSARLAIGQRAPRSHSSTHVPERVTWSVRWRPY